MRRVERRSLASTTATPYYGGWATGRFASATRSAGVSMDVYVAFEQQSETLATTLVGVMAPAFALVLAGALFWTGASGTPFFATHITTFAMAGSVVLRATFMGVQFALRWIGADIALGTSIDPAFAVAMVIYFLLAARRACDLRWRQALAVATRC